MTNFILSAAFTAVVATVASVMGTSEYNDTDSVDSNLNNVEIYNPYHLSEQEQIDIYEQVMDECVLK